MAKVVHLEIPFDMKFYGDTFGWQLMDMPEMSYVAYARVKDTEGNIIGLFESARPSN